MHHVDDWLHALQRGIPSNIQLESCQLDIDHDRSNGATELDDTLESCTAADFNCHGVQPHFSLLRETL